MRVKASIHASELADTVIIIIGVVTAYTSRCKACMSPTISHRRLEVSLLMSLLSRDWTKTQHMRGASVSISEGRGINTCVWHSIPLPLQVKLQSRQRNNAGSSQNRSLCSTNERKLEISTVLHIINLPQHNIPATLWTLGHMAIFIEQQGCVPLCNPPPPSPQIKPSDFQTPQHAQLYHAGKWSEWSIPVSLNGKCG